MRFDKNFAAWTLVAGLTAPLLTGCFGVAAVGVGATALMVADRRPSEVYLADEAIELRVMSRIGEKYGNDPVHVNATSFNHALLLTGEVPSAAVKADIDKITATVPNVKSIANELQVAGVSSLGARSNDSYITSKVKGRFVDGSKFAANNVKVVTEAGVVYLMGLVTRRESDDAVDIARTTGGVSKVVRVMEIISDEDARRLDNQAAPGSGAPATSAGGKAPTRKP